MTFFGNSKSIDFLFRGEEGHLYVLHILAKVMHYKHDFFFANAKHSFKGMLQYIFFNLIFQFLYETKLSFSPKNDNHD